MGTSSKRSLAPIHRVRLAPYRTPEAYAAQAERPGWMRGTQASENPCTTCPGLCCELMLSLSVQDIARVSLSLEVDPRQFCHLEESADTWRSPAIRVDGQPRHPMLNSGPGRACSFRLSLGSGSYRCGIYELRPMTCRLYPFRWERDGLVEGPRAIWCPSEWLVSRRARRRILALIRSAHAEEVESWRIIRAFGRQRRFPATVKGFFEYALVKGGQQLGLDPEPMLRRMRSRRLGPALW